MCDPHLEHVDEYLALAEAAGAGIGHVFETHVQADHVSGALELARRAGAKVYVHESADVAFPHVDVSDGDEIQLGNDYVRVLHTPGHSEDSVCYLLPRETALSVLGRPAGAGFVAGTLRERLTRTGHVAHALPELGTIRVSELIARPPSFCAPYTTIRHAAGTSQSACSSAMTSIAGPTARRIFLNGSSARSRSAVVMSCPRLASA